MLNKIKCLLGMHTIGVEVFHEAMAPGDEDYVTTRCQHCNTSGERGNYLSEFRWM